MNKLQTIDTSAVEVKLENMTKIFGDEEGKVIAVDDFTASFPAGQLTTLLGPSGCGKTTTLRCIGGLSEPEHGDVFIGGERVNGIPAYSRPTGTVFQSYALFPHMSVFENVAYGLKIRKKSKKEIKEKVEESLDILGLKGMRDRSPGQLSGGQQQRVAVARVLVLEPKVLLFDEPLSNLDAKLRVSMREQIRSIQRKIGITTIYVTHDQEEAMAISDTLIVMNEGRIMQVGTPIDVYKKPDNEFVAEFIGLINLLDGKVEELNGGSMKLKIYDAEIDVPKSENESYTVGEDVRITVRPESIYFAEKGSNSFTGKIIKSTFLGPIVRYKIEMVDGKVLTMDVHNPKTMRDKNSQVILSLDKDTLTFRKTIRENG